ncbi:acyl carrier protein [Microbulbifer sp. HZ11]|uniref:acyl carrier protein n=1 Tax=unclassified Microbulbifer TaxID=2619833 RepID=UPI0005BBA8C9|nr:acyl carrier protein [Microbulbifer sp. HZ11]
MDNLIETIRSLAIEAGELEDTEIGLQDNLEDVGLDSLAGLEITVGLEKKYKVKVPPSRYEEMVTIQAIADLINELVDAKEAATA